VAHFLMDPGPGLLQSKRFCFSLKMKLITTMASLLVLVLFASPNEAKSAPRLFLIETAGNKKIIGHHGDQMVNPDRGTLLDGSDNDNGASEDYVDSDDHDQVCKVRTLHGAEGGEKSKKPCVFPFRHHGQEFTNCTTYGNPFSRAWCSVEVDPVTGNHVQGQLGYCRTGCGFEMTEREKELVKEEFSKAGCLGQTLYHLAQMGQSLYYTPRDFAMTMVEQCLHHYQEMRDKFMVACHKYRHSRDCITRDEEGGGLRVKDGCFGDLIARYVGRPGKSDEEGIHCHLYCPVRDPDMAERGTFEDGGNRTSYTRCSLTEDQLSEADLEAANDEGKENDEEPENDDDQENDEEPENDDDEELDETDVRKESFDVTVGRSYTIT